MDRNLIVGFWKFKSNRIRQGDGSWLPENLSGGTIAFSEGGEVCLFLRSDEEGAWGYSGRYETSGDKMKVRIETSLSKELEGTSIDRQFRFLNEDEFLLTGVEVNTDRLFETHCVRVQ